MRTSAREYLAEHRDAVVAQLTEWVRLPSIAGVPQHLVDLRRSANWLAATFAVLPSESVDAPVIFFGTGLPEDHWHDSDERVSIDVLLAGAATLAAFWDRLPTVRAS